MTHPRTEFQLNQTYADENNATVNCRMWSNLSLVCSNGAGVRWI